ncbi:MAG: ATP-binding protein [Clostridia bacterium]|nr:ATP-binding protein [Clostridia bacterium]
MYRQKMEELKKWKESSHRKPLIIRGARQVGKTWLMKEFGRNFYEKIAYINFDDNTRMNKLFEEDFDLERIIQGLKIESGVNIEPENTLIILDEIQETPKALKALKYFCENAREYHVVSAGSLLGVAMHSGTSFPVGKVDFLDLTPLSFYEFLEAIGEKELLKLLKNNDFNMIEVFSTKLKEFLKLYYYIGGMPEAVNSYVENKNLLEVRDIQKKLLAAYEQDFSKHAPNNIVPRIRQLWNNIPTQLAKENKKFIYGLVRQGARAREYELALSWLIDCGLIYQVNRVNTSKIPLSAYQDFNAFKLYLLDVGLLSALSGIDDKTLLEGNDIFEEFKGSLTEQYVLCQLKQCTNLEVFYWSSDTGTSEVDFITQIGRNNIPIEVKASENLQAKSLKTFVQKYQTKINVRTSMSSYRKEDWVINIPLYNIGNIEKINNTLINI